MSDVITQPDILAQFQLNSKRQLEPEKALMFAVLEDAVGEYQKYAFAKSGRAKVLFEEAREWILGNDEEWLFSFVNVCESLGFDSCYIREGLERWYKSQSR